MNVTVDNVTVPDVVGLTQAAATTAIVAVNLIVGTVTTQNSATVPAGDVISQNPAGWYAGDEGTAVDLVVSSGPVQATVPDVVDQLAGGGRPRRSWRRI